MSNQRKTLPELVKKLESFENSMRSVQTNDLNGFKSLMLDFRNFLKDSVLASSGWYAAFNRLISESEDYHNFKIYFTHAENYFERLVEVEENEKILNLKDKPADLENFLNQYLSDDFNKLFYGDVKIEINKLNEYYLKDKPFLMVGCGSLPITLLSYCCNYKNGQFIGIDNSPEAVIYANRIKEYLSIPNLKFETIDGMNYDYKNVKTIFIANTVIPKMNVLKQIAMSASTGSKIIIRVPIASGNLLSEDVNYSCIPRIRCIKEIEPDKKITDDLLYKLLVLEVR